MQQSSPPPTHTPAVNVEDSRVYNNTIVTMATARRRMTTTRAAASAITAGVWSVQAGQGPA